MSEKTCPACHHDNESDAQYCAHCGTFLGTDTTPYGKTTTSGYYSKATNSAERTGGTVPRESERRLQRTVVLGGLLAAILIVLALFVGMQLGSRQGLTSASSSTLGQIAGQTSTAVNPGPTSPPPTRAKASATYPKLAGQYSGTSHDTMCVVGINNGGCYCFYTNGQVNANCDYTLLLTSIVQNQNKFNGYLTRNSPRGSGAFTGTITSDGKVTFTVISNNLDVGQIIEVYTGDLQSDGSISGTWTASSSQGSQSGPWRISPS